MLILADEEFGVPKTFDCAAAPWGFPILFLQPVRAEGKARRWWVRSVVDNAPEQIEMSAAEEGNGTSDCNFPA